MILLDRVDQDHCSAGAPLASRFHERVRPKRDQKGEGVSDARYFSRVLCGHAVGRGRAGRVRAGGLRSDGLPAHPHPAGAGSKDLTAIRALLSDGTVKRWGTGLGSSRSSRPATRNDHCGPSPPNGPKPGACIVPAFVTAGLRSYEVVQKTVMQTGWEGAAGEYRAEPAPRAARKATATPPGAGCAVIVRCPSRSAARRGLS